MTVKKAKLWTMKQVQDELSEVARLGEIFLDGDLCRKLWQPYAEKFMCGDDMDYNPEAGVPVKKTLFRLERAGHLPCSTALWRRRADYPESGEALLYGSHASPYDTDKPKMRGYVPPKMTPEMESVFLRGERATTVNMSYGRAAMMAGRGLAVRVRGVKRPTAVQVFTPVKDSMGEIAAALEVFTMAVS